jgi:uncharacterized protein with HEPN domain
MTRHDDDVSLRQMLDHAYEIHELLREGNRDDYLSNRLLNLAVVQLFQILGEAANRVSNETQTQHPEIPWRAIIGVRNQLIHGYDTIDHEIVWDASQKHIPELIQQLERAIAKRTNS